MEYRISELCDIRRGASPRPIKNFIVESHEDSFPWVKIADATKDSSRYISITKERVSKEGSLKSVEVVPGDLIISNSATPGLPKIMKTKAFIHDGWLLLRNFKNVRKEFLYYVLIQNREKLLQLSNGSVFNNLKTDIVKNFKVNIPSLKTQDVILRMITMIEDKLDLNKQIIENLEEFSQTIFKRWFVDFEFPDENGNPYKLSGGEMVDSELGEIPSGWKIIELKEVTEIIMGQSPKSDTYNTQNEGLPLLNGATDFKNRNIKPTKYTTDPKKIGQFGDFVFGVRATVGLVTELDRDYAIGRGAGIARINSTHKEWLYEILVKAFQYFENSISGSVYINVSSNDLKKSKVIYPSKKILDAYHKNLVNNFELVKSMKMQIKHLTQLRDTLLPKLMAGEIEIPDDIEVNEDELSI
ncbi:restriction endonuclease subunit S [Staphylococcus equorum]|uniref:restriction endonuclease subunit S n=1 Tax=Staphylococcus equorum TaxID=246432 RepID=UPI000D1C9362|nr:restriction endonuclease subunit S [Staphylococcus equorum]PTE80166.1 restriction endonuclease subunit S [Staphylococcus equorum]